MNIKTACTQVFLIGAIRAVAGQGPLDDFISNVEDAVRPAQNAAGNFFNNVGNTIASVADQAGDFAASMATNAINDANSFQQSQISAELSSYHSSGVSVVYGEWVAAAACIATVACLGNLV
ncbi:hypothetical protein IWW50_004666 [Coemansia erecta]|nr:hypothetical protein GGF43_004015 [Coemansia sp. RSA 2618]KAJ2821363.1 hypothetical protein IWW50_004666 [Coemansia erecta]